MTGIVGKTDVEAWLLEQVGPAYDALKASPSSAKTANEIRAHLAEVATKTVDARTKSPSPPFRGEKDLG